MDTKEHWHLWFGNFLIKGLGWNGFKSTYNSQLAEELHKPIIKNFEKKGLFFI